MGNSKRASGGKRGIIKAVASLLIVLIVAGGGVVVYGYNYLKGLAANPMNPFEQESKSNDLSIVVQNSAGQDIAYRYNKDLVVIGLFGIDTDSERKQQRMGYRSDTMVVCAVDVVEKKAALITCPRDTKAMVKKLDAKNGEVLSEQWDKLGHAYAYGGGRNNYSYANACDAISNLFDLGELEIPPITLYAGIDMDGLPPIASKVGGVPVTLRQNIPGYGKAGETIVLNSNNASDFVRLRSGAGLSGSDLDRTKRQQDFLKGLAKRVQEMGPIEAVPKLYKDLINIVDTNLNEDQMAALAMVLKDMDVETIDFHMVPGKAETQNKTSYYIPDMDALHELIISLFYKEN
ncbi:MAG: LCP family protein [Christensenellales bacterium]|jgi:LCP family protein required for cell wall assembly